MTAVLKSSRLALVGLVLGTVYCLSLLGPTYGQENGEIHEAEVAKSKQRAAAKFPDLRDPNSEMFKLVKEASAEIPKRRPDFLLKPDWPEILAESVNQFLLTQQQAQLGPAPQVPEPQEAEVEAAPKSVFSGKIIAMMRLLIAAEKNPRRRAKLEEQLEQMIALQHAVDGVAGVANPVENGNDVVESRIDGNFDGWDGDTIFKLENGQIWEQADLQINVAMRLRPRVIIFRDAGEWFMKVEREEKMIKVRRLK